MAKARDAVTTEAHFAVLDTFVEMHPMSFGIYLFNRARLSERRRRPFTVW